MGLGLAYGQACDKHKDILSVLEYKIHTQLMHPWCKATEIRYCAINQFDFTICSCAIDIQLT